MRPSRPRLASFKLTGTPTISSGRFSIIRIQLYQRVQTMRSAADSTRRVRAGEVEGRAGQAVQVPAASGHWWDFGLIAQGIEAY